jgi:hypothetical protein
MDVTQQPARAMRAELPAKPDWFDSELEAIRVVEGLPLFKCVDGQRETVFRNGKMDIKHLFQTDKVACYVRIVTQKYYRKNLKTGRRVYFDSLALAGAVNPDLAVKITPDITTEVRAIGRPCWIIESLIPPSKEVPPHIWEKDRHQIMESRGTEKRVDVLGPRPANGRYIHCMDLLSPEGEPIAPNHMVIEELKRRVWEFDHDRKTFDQRVRDEHQASAEFERKQNDRILEAVYSDLPFGGIGLHHGAVSKPILTVKE